MTAPVIERWADGGGAGGDAPRVLVLPGSRYPAHRPGLAWPIRALELQGWQVWCAAWELAARRHREECQVTVDAAVQRFLDVTGSQPSWCWPSLSPHWPRSGGRRAARARRLDDAVAPRRRVRGQPRPKFRTGLLVAGSRSHTWDDAAARRTGKEILVVPGADHGWQTGGWHTELGAVGEVTAAVADFAARVRP
ncbi:MAG: hypothetical protein R2734_15735 [Nocardioides sp.]